jgi:hypothetical protein
VSLRFVHVGVALVLPPLFTCLKFTDPRGRVCRPYAHFASAENPPLPKVEPDAPVWAPVVCHGQAVQKGAVPAQGNPNSMP